MAVFGDRHAPVSVIAMGEIRTQGASAETLLAIAGALNVDVNLLRFDTTAFLSRRLGIPGDQLTPEFLTEKKKEFDAEYTTVPLTRVTASADFQAIYNAQAMFFDCTVKRDDVQDAAAALQSELFDILNVGRELEATVRRQCEVSAFSLVTELGTLGAVVTLGFHHRRLALTNQESVPLTILFVIITPKSEEQKFAIIPKHQPIRFA